MWPKESSGTSLMIEKAKHGDVAAFEDLYMFYSRSVYALCFRLTKDILEAEDLTQEVFLQVYRKVNTFRGEAAFGSWLYRVAKNVTMMHLRKRHIDELPFDDLAADIYPKSYAESSLFVYDPDPVERLALIRALGNLSQSRRKMVILHDIKGMPHHEIAKRLGVTENTSKSTLSRAHQKLRDTLAVTSSIFM